MDKKELLDIITKINNKRKEKKKFQHCLLAVCDVNSPMYKDMKELDEKLQFHYWEYGLNHEETVELLKELDKDEEIELFIHPTHKEEVGIHFIPDFIKRIKYREKLKDQYKEE